MFLQKCYWTNYFSKIVEREKYSIEDRALANIQLKKHQGIFFKNAELKDLLISDLEAAGGSNTHTTSTMHAALFLPWNVLNYSLKLIEWVTRHSPGVQPHEGPLCLCATQQHSVMDHSSDPSLHLHRGDTHTQITQWHFCGFELGTKYKFAVPVLRKHNYLSYLFLI